MEANKIHKYCKCCICQGALAKVPIMAQVPVTVSWGYPVWGNFLTGKSSQGCAYICDACEWTKGLKDIKYVVEFTGDTGVRYHAIAWPDNGNAILQDDSFKG